MHIIQNMDQILLNSFMSPSVKLNGVFLIELGPSYEILNTCKIGGTLSEWGPQDLTHGLECLKSMEQWQVTPAKDLTLSLYVLLQLLEILIDDEHSVHEYFRGPRLPSGIKAEAAIKWLSQEKALDLDSW